MTSSPLRAGASLEEELEYYKKQYEQLEHDLADFQASSKELEEQLEKDIDAAEKNERKLKEQVEKLGFEVDEWKGKHKQAKAEANSTHNTLQKEITTIREQHRSVQLKLRDIEVANDDYERQARNTTSSLEDLESKLNISIERGVLMDEEVKAGEKEREGLRIENQRLRDELGDLKVESEITLEKLRLAGKSIEELRSRKPSNLAVQNLRAMSPGSEASGVTPSSPATSSPPTNGDTASETQTPPSPPLSEDALANGKAEPKTPLPTRRALHPDTGFTPRSSVYWSRAMSRHSRGPSLASSTSNANGDARAMRPPPSKAAKAVVSPPRNVAAGLPRSESLYQMKSLRSRMQKIEERVQSARSKLPPPRDTTPKASPRTGSGLSAQIPSSITVRRTSKQRPSNAGTSLLANGESGNEEASTGRRESQSHVKRLSYGIPRPSSRASAAPSERPSSRASLAGEGSSAAASRPASRLSMAGAGTRAESRSSARTEPAGSRTAERRPRSSMGGSGFTGVAGTVRTHRPSASISELRRRVVDGEESGLAHGNLTTPGRRTTMEKGFAMPASPALSRRQSSGFHAATGTRGLGRRSSIPAVSDGDMRPPPSRRKMAEVPDDALDESELGETY